MSKLDKARSDYPIFDEFCADSTEEGDTLEQFYEYISRWPNDLSTWVYNDYIRHWNTWV